MSPSGGAGVMQPEPEMGEEGNDQGGGDSGECFGMAIAMQCKLRTHIAGKCHLLWMLLAYPAEPYLKG